MNHLKTGKSKNREKGFYKNMHERTKKAILKTGFAGAALAGLLVLFTANAADAQYRRNDRRADARIDRPENRNLVRIAEAKGYSDGLSEGNKNLRQGKRYDPYGTGKYRKATSGYQSRLGSKNAYKRFYQTAFVRGYNESYSRGGTRDNRRVRRSW